LNFHKKEITNSSVSYQKSGLWSAQVFLVYLFAGIPLAFFWACLYALALVYSPGCFANGFYILLFAFLMARVDSLMVIHYGKVRNGKVAKLFGYFSVIFFFLSA